MNMDFVNISNAAIIAERQDKQEWDQAIYDGKKAYLKGLERRKERSKAHRWDMTVTIFACICGVLGGIIMLLSCGLFALIF